MADAVGATDGGGVLFERLVGVIGFSLALDVDTDVAVVLIPEAVEFDAELAATDG